MPDAKDYPDDIKSSVSIIHNMIGDLEKAGFDSKNIIVGGIVHPVCAEVCRFLKLARLLSYHVQVSEASWGCNLLQRLVDGTKFALEANKETPIFWGHGADDMTVHFSNQETGVASSAPFLLIISVSLLPILLSPMFLGVGLTMIVGQVNALKGQGFKVMAHSYPDIPHSTCEEEHRFENTAGSAVH
eukprot:762556-Hanusia_phi.AAC.7